MTEYSLLLACDLDRTIFPNGPEIFSENAKLLFSEFLEHSNVCLVYISGRSLARALSGIAEYRVPHPHIYVGDVGTSMYVFGADEKYIEHTEWQSRISSDWNGIKGSEINELLGDIPGLVEQEKENQNTFKQSYYFPEDAKDMVVNEVQKRLLTLDIQFQIVTLVDHDLQKGYLDIIPSSANKENATRYLQEFLSFSTNNIVYAGDGGNDLAPITSGYKAIVVNNATKSFKQEVKNIAEQKGILQNVYFAHGGFNNLNGNYTAGIIEGLNHFGYL
jgi:HAD superfamily hydrolase (TIGR01484 family)